MFWLLIPLIIDVVSIIIFLRLLFDDSRYKFAEHPLFALTYLVISVPVVVGCTMAFTGVEGIGVWVAWLLVIAFAGPCVLPAVAAFGAGFSDFLVFPGAKRIVVPKTCDQAERAEREEKFEKAERLYRETLAAAKEEDADRYAPIHLQFGNFLQRRGRLEEAAEQWRRAVAGDLEPTQCLLTALRAADALAAKSNFDLAADVLTQTLEKHPREQEASALRQRLNALPARLGKQPGNR